MGAPLTQDTYLPTIEESSRNCKEQGRRAASLRVVLSHSFLSRAVVDENYDDGGEQQSFDVEEVLDTIEANGWHDLDWEHEIR